MKKKCIECGDVISAARLKLVPDTEYCIECLETLEKDGKGTIRAKGHYNAQLQGHRMESVEILITKK